MMKDMTNQLETLIGLMVNIPVGRNTIIMYTHAHMHAHANIGHGA